MSFLEPKIWNKVSLNIKTAATTSFTHRLEKEILSELQEWAILLIFSIIIIIFFFNFLKVDFFTIFLYVHMSRGTLMEIRTVLDLF